MKVKFTIYPIKKLARAAGDAALDAAAYLGENTSVVGRKAEEVLSKVRLEREIRDLQEEIDLQMRAIGEIMYASHCGTDSYDEEMADIMEYVDGLQEELESHKREQESLRGNLICPNCGESNGPDNFYCQNCGTALPESCRTGNLETKPRRASESTGPVTFDASN